MIKHVRIKRTVRRGYRRRHHGPRRTSWMFNPLDSFIDASIGNNLADARKKLLAFANDDNIWDQIAKAQSIAAERKVQSEHLSKLSKKYFG